MAIESQPQRRKFIRLKGYDYSSEGGYFITIVTHNRIPFFGKIVDGEVQLSPSGEIAHREWFKTMNLRGNVELFEDEFVVMPNHIHGIIWLTGTLAVGVERQFPVVERRISVGVERRSTPTSVPFVTPGSIPAIVRAYKSAVTYTINSIQNSRGNPIWQRNYYEHIIGDEKEYENIWDYIYTNPQNWVRDEENVEIL